jgi:hypothetical protein
MGGTFYDEYIKENESTVIAIEKSSAELVAANNEKMQVRQACSVLVSIGHISKWIPFQVVDALHYSIILGNDALTSLKARIDVDNELLWLEDGPAVTITVRKKQLLQQQQPTYAIHLIGTTKIPPRSIARLKVKAHCQGKEVNEALQGWVNTELATFAKHGVSIRPGIVQLTSDGTTIVDVMNPQRCQVKIYHNSTLGRLTMDQNTTMINMTMQSTTPSTSTTTMMMKDGQASIVEQINLLDLHTDTRLTSGQQTIV